MQKYWIRLRKNSNIVSIIERKKYKIVDLARDYSRLTDKFVIMFVHDKNYTKDELIVQCTKTQWVLLQLILRCEIIYRLYGINSGYNFPTQTCIGGLSHLIKNLTDINR